MISLIRKEQKIKYPEKLILSFIFLLLSFTTLISQTITDNDLFSLSLEELLDIEITTAGKQVEKIPDIPASVVIITREDIHNFGYQSLSDILQNVPGFYMIDDYFWLGSKNFGVRGFFSTGTFNDVIILVNGINQIGDAYSDYSTAKINIPIEAIDRIEIIRGPMSVIYGSGAFFGAINIITNSQTEDKPENIYSLTYGTDQKRAYAGLKTGTDDHYIEFNATSYEENGINISFSDLTDNAEFLNNVSQTPSGRTDKLLGSNGKHFDLIGSWDNISINLSYDESRIGMFDGMPSIGNGSFINTRSSIASINHRKELSSNVSLLLRAGYFFHNFSFDYEELFPKAYAVNHSSTTAMELEAVGFYTYADNLNLSTGFFQRSVLSVNRNYDYPIFADKYSNVLYTLSQGENVTTRALYSQLNYTPFSKIKLTAGIRFEQQSDYEVIYSGGNETDAETFFTGHIDNNDVSIIPRIAGIYTISKKQIFKLMYGEATKFPSISQSISQMTNGEPALSPARIKTLEFNYIFTKSTHFSININAYHNSLENLIVKRNQFDHETGTWMLHSTNQGQQLIHGLETEIYYSIKQQLFLYLSGTYQRSANKEPGFEDIQLAYSPQFLGLARLTYNLPLSSIISMNSRYIGKMEAEWNNDPIDTENGDLSPIGRIGSGSKAYTVFDVHYKMENIFSSNFGVAILLSNILNTDIQYPTTRSNSWISNGSIGKSRNITFTVEYIF